MDLNNMVIKIKGDLNRISRSYAFWVALGFSALLGRGLAYGEPSNKLLTMGTSQEFDSLNQLLTTASAAHYLMTFTNRSLVQVNPDWKWECHLCVELPTRENGLVKVIDENGKKKMLVTWKIKPEAVWSDGTPITGKDFKFSWEVGTDKKVSVGEREYYDRVEEIILNDKDPKTFVMKFKEVRFDFQNLQAFYVMPAHIEETVYRKHRSQMGAYEKNSTYVTHPTRLGLSNGPYIVKEVKLGSHVTFVKNPKWYGKPASIETITVKLISNTQTLEANLVSGTVDMINELGLSFDQAVALEKRLQRDPALGKKFRVQFEESIVYEHIELNLDNPILADIRVRKALMHAMDRQKLVDALFQNKQKVTHTYVHPRDVFFTENVVRYEYDLGKAGALLDEAGWKMGPQGFREKNGQKLSLNIMTTAGNKTRELVQVFLQEQLKKVGVELSINNVPARVLFGEVTPKRQFPALVMFAQTATPENIPASVMHSRQIPAKENGYGGQNYAGWKNKRNDEIIDLAPTELDGGKRKGLMAEQQKIFSEDLPHFPLYMRADVVVLPSNLKGYRMTGHLVHPSHWAEYWSF